MKRLSIVLCLLSSLSASAFDAEAWEAKNEAMAREAARMKAAYADYSAKVTKPAEDVTVPFETFDSGEIKSTLVAKRGHFFHDTGFVWAQDVLVEQFKEDGSLDIRLVAENCLVDRPGKCCWIAGHVRAEHRKTTLEGDDAFYCSSNNFLKVMTHASVVSEDVKMKGLTL